MCVMLALGFPLRHSEKKGEFPETFCLEIKHTNHLRLVFEQLKQQRFNNSRHNYKVLFPVSGLPNNCV